MAAQARTILVAYDGSETSRRALDAAADLAGYGSTLTVVGLGRNGTQAPVTPAAVLAEARERLLRRHILARYVEPIHELVDLARELAADLLVVGRTRAAGVSAAALRAVVDDAPCDVLVIA